jgi:oxygen-independent coproporphyrinogen-3 oxidase
VIAGLYLHIPFCERRCHYCDFNTYEGMTGLAPDYCIGLERDLAQSVARGARSQAGGLQSLYLGGGTPSLLEPAQLLGLLDAAQRHLGLAPDAEVTLEVNPGTADQRKLTALRKGGFNRVSFGFQAAQDRHLQALGRIHDAKQSDAAWDAARAAGFDNMSLDLMFGLSTQTQEEWRESLAWALARSPEHVSFYGLTIEPGTRFHHWRGQGSLPLPDDEAQAAMYEQGLEAMAGAGLEQYEISNFARPGRQARHNRLYWFNQDTLGLGAGAWSFVDGRRSGRIKQPQAYLAAVAEGREPVAEAERLEGRAARAEAATLALRMNQGLDLGAWKERHGEDFEAEFGPALGPVFKAGCLSQEAGRLALTAKGRLLANEVFERLL